MSLREAHPIVLRRHTGVAFKAFLDAQTELRDQEREFLATISEVRGGHAAGDALSQVNAREKALLLTLQGRYHEAVTRLAAAVAQEFRH